MDRPAEAPPRIAALDLARGLALLFMVWVHVLEEWASMPVQLGPYGRVVEAFGSVPAAPVFMVLMGASLAFTSRTSPAALARRGLQILLLAFALNAVRGALPAWIGLRFGLVDAAALGPYTPWRLLWNVDILGFAGPALVLLGLLKSFERPLAWVVVAAGVAVAAPHLWGLATGWPVVDGVLRHLWGDDVMVSFPIFPWLAYPLVGMAWGTWLARGDEARVFRETFVGSLALALACSGFFFTDGARLLGDHWRLGPEGVGLVLGLVGLWLCLCRWLLRALPTNPAFDLLAFWSKRVTRFYVVQWLIVAWGTGLAGHHALGVAGTALGQVVVPALAHGVTVLWARRWPRRWGPF